MLGPMSKSLDKLLDEARRLPEEDRLRLVEALLSMADGGAEPGTAEAWAAEIARRTRDVDAGLVSPVPWSEVREGMKRRTSND